MEATTLTLWSELQCMGACPGLGTCPGHYGMYSLICNGKIGGALFSRCLGMRP